MEKTEDAEHRTNSGSVKRPGELMISERSAKILFFLLVALVSASVAEMIWYSSRQSS